MKGRQVAIIILLILLIDQAIKIYIKTHYYAGQEHLVLGQKWFRLHFVENPGMAWGWNFGGGFGKIALSLFRLIAVVIGTFYLRNMIQKKQHKGLIICAALVYAGAMGNLIDSMFYGLIFEHSEPFNNVAKMFPAGGGYAGFLHGKVVDMFYFPIISGVHFPSWVPFWGGEEFEFFRPVFNVADASISVGIFIIIIFQNRFFKKETEAEHHTIETNTPVTDDAQVM